MALELFKTVSNRMPAAAMICLQIIKLFMIWHYDDVIMTTIASQITSLTVVYSTVYSDADQSKHQKLRVTGLCVGNSPGPVNSPHKGPVTRKMFPFDDVIMRIQKLEQPKRRTIIYGLQTFPYLGSKLWNLPASEDNEVNDIDLERLKFLMKYWAGPYNHGPAIDDVIKWKHFPLSLICARKKGLSKQSWGW